MKVDFSYEIAVFCPPSGLFLILVLPFWGRNLGRFWAYRVSTTLSESISKVWGKRTVLTASQGPSVTLNGF